MTIEWEAGVQDIDRIAALERSGLIGTGPEDEFDRLVELAVELTGVRGGCVTLVDAHRYTYKSRVGLRPGSPISGRVEESFCRFVVGSGRPLIVEDARRDPRTVGDPVIELHGIAAWAGYPIDDGDGAVLGTFCLIDIEAHYWTDIDIVILATLAKAVSTEIALRRVQAELADARREFALRIDLDQATS